MSDIRHETYRDLHSSQLAEEEKLNASSADQTLSLLQKHLKPQSMLDVGCGLGTWLAAAQRMGIGDLAGIEGHWLDPKALKVARELVKQQDLEAGFDLGRKFDLLVCLEVAEHLSAKSAEHFIQCLTRHSPAIAFSAAVPFQGGHHHVNEQFLPYWVDMFARQGYRMIDLFRQRLWNRPDVLWWLRQNMVLFIDGETALKNDSLRHELQQQHGPGPISIIHPELYLSRMQQAAKHLKDYGRLRQQIGTGGTFRLTFGATGELTATRVRQP